MAFRDDRDALRAKASSLERELAETRDELEDAKSKLNRRKTERRETQKRAAFAGVKQWFSEHRIPLWLILGGAAVAGAAVFFFSFDSGPPRGQVLFGGEGHVMAIRGEPGVTLGADCHVRIVAQDGFPWNCTVNVTCDERQLYAGFTDCRIVDDEAVFAHDTAYESDGDPIMRFDREAQSVLVEDALWRVSVSLGPRPAFTSGRATWAAIVERAVGTDVEIATECTLSAGVTSNGYVPGSLELSIRCGEDDLYRSNTAAPGLEWSLSEGPAPEEGAFEYALLFEDAAGEDTRTRATVDTRQRRARVWRDASPSMFVEFRVDDVSAPRQGEPLDRTNESAAEPFAVELLVEPESATEDAPK